MASTVLSAARWLVSWQWYVYLLCVLAVVAAVLLIIRRMHPTSDVTSDTTAPVQFVDERVSPKRPLNNVRPPPRSLFSCPPPVPADPVAALTAGRFALLCVS